MTRTNNFVLSVVLLFSALALSACATKPKEAAVAEPAPAAMVAEQAATSEPAPEPVTTPEPVSVPEVAEQTAPAPVVMAEQPAPKPVVKKARKKAAIAKIAPKVEEPVPVAAPEPAPVVQQEAPAAAPPEPTPPPVIAEPVHQEATPGFLESYWLWLLGAVIAVIAFLWMKKKS